MKLRLGGLLVLAGFALDFWQPVASFFIFLSSLLFSRSSVSSLPFFPPSSFHLSVYLSVCFFFLFFFYSSFFVFERSRPTFTWSRRDPPADWNCFRLCAFTSPVFIPSRDQMAASFAPAALFSPVHLKGLISRQVLHRLHCTTPRLKSPPPPAGFSRQRLFTRIFVRRGFNEGSSVSVFSMPLEEAWLWIKRWINPVFKRGLWFPFLLWIDREDWEERVGRWRYF